MLIKYLYLNRQLMKYRCIYRWFFIIPFIINSFSVISQENQGKQLPKKEEVTELLYRVNDHFTVNAWKNNDRNWIRGTYYTGLMAFYKITRDSSLLEQAKNWAQKHGWRVGTEWLNPANRLTCSQTYLQIYFTDPNPGYISRTRSFMDKRIEDDEPARQQGYDYVDALYVGVPPYYMMSKATGEQKYADYANRIFWQLADDLYDEKYHLFYRDEKAKKEKSENGMPVFWSRGNGWAIASIPRILTYIPEDEPAYSMLIELLNDLAGSLAACQGDDGFWRTSLMDPDEFPEPESSGTAFFTYAMAWGINHGLLDKKTFLPVVVKAWLALTGIVDKDGKVGYGQRVSRDPGHVAPEDSHEFVAGAFLLAGSEIHKLCSGTE